MKTSFCAAAAAVGLVAIGAPAVKATNTVYTAQVSRRWGHVFLPSHVCDDSYRWNVRARRVLKRVRVFYALLITTAGLLYCCSSVWCDPAPSTS